MVKGLTPSGVLRYDSLPQQKSFETISGSAIESILYGPYSMELYDFRHCILMLRKNGSYDLFGRIGSYHTLISSWISRHKASLSSYLEICNGNKDCSMENDCVLSDPGFSLNFQDEKSDKGLKTSVFIQLNMCYVSNRENR